MPRNLGRRSIRLRGHDYTHPGAYFVTLCTQNRECLFGEILDGEMRLNAFGRIVRDEWLRPPEIRHEIALDAFVIVPNHLHGILVIRPLALVGETRGLPLPGPSVAHTECSPFEPGPRTRSLGAIIALFKSVSGRRINELRGTPGVRVWQRNYYDHIIRHDAALYRIQRYIELNPLQWERDRENPGQGVR